MEENNIPESAMVIVAHPDDAEFTVAGTVATWVKAGCCVTYVVCTDGNTGSHEAGMTREKLAEIRRAEQRAACATLGVSQVMFLGYDDGQLQPTLDLRRDLVRAIRQHKPEAIITWDPTRWLVGDEYINHPDHRAAAQAALDAAVPASAMPLLWPEVGAPHRVRQVYIYGHDEPNLWVDVTEAIEQDVQHSWPQVFGGDCPEPGAAEKAEKNPHRSGPWGKRHGIYGCAGGLSRWSSVAG
jgi:LmbE family N-acetylglucosaminyl deacetylase